MPTHQDTTDSSPTTSSAPSDELCTLTAIELARRIRQKQVSARDVMAAHLARIERVNPKINAIVTLVADRAMADAAKADEQQARGRPLGPLHGLPVAHKDLVPTAGIRTTFGSPFFKDNVPTKDALDRHAHPRGRRDHARQNEHAGVRRWIEHVQPRVRRDAQSVQPHEDRGRQQRRRRGVAHDGHGSDRRRQRHRRIAAQSGGVEQRRRLRPSPGRVPHDDGTWSPLSTSGPMARTVADVALFLSAIAGPLAADPLTIDEDPRALSRAPRPVVQGRARRVVQGPRRTAVRAGDHARRQCESSAFEQLGCVVEEAEPDFAGVDEAFPIICVISRITRATPRWRASIPTW